MLAFVPPFSGFLMLAEALNTIPTIPDINGIYIYHYTLDISGILVPVSKKLGRRQK
jgi:hypothetical protein